MHSVSGLQQYLQPTMTGPRVTTVEQTSIVNSTDKYSKPGLGSTGGPYLGLGCAHEVSFAVAKVTDLQQRQRQALDHLHTIHTGAGMHHTQHICTTCVAMPGSDQWEHNEVHQLAREPEIPGNSLTQCMHSMDSLQLPPGAYRGDGIPTITSYTAAANSAHSLPHRALSAQQQQQPPHAAATAAQTCALLLQSLQSPAAVCSPA